VSKQSNSAGWQIPATGSGFGCVQAQPVGRFAHRCSVRFNRAMPELTRRRSPDAPDECWRVWYGDVRVARGLAVITTGILLLERGNH